MVGTALTQCLASHELITPSRYQLNVGNYEQVMKFKADLIIHLSAETDHEYCDLNPSNCYYINTIGTANMVELAKKLNVPIVFIGAGSIFDGLLNRPYEYYDQPNPINHYNKSKYYAELMVVDYRKHYIIRPGWMFGGGPNIDKKFVNKLITKIWAGQTEIKCATDCIGSPTYSKDLAQAIADIILLNFEFGTYHCVNKSDGVSRYDFGVEVVKCLGLSDSVKIVPCSIDDLKDEFPCKRTNYEVLKSNLPMPDWKESLRSYIDAYYRN